MSEMLQASAALKERVTWAWTRAVRMLKTAQVVSWMPGCEVRFQALYKVFAGWCVMDHSVELHCSEVATTESIEVGLCRRIYSLLRHVTTQKPKSRRVTPVTNAVCIS